MANLRCEVCGEEIVDHVCATSTGTLLCWRCFVAFLKARAEIRDEMVRRYGKDDC